MRARGCHRERRASLGRDRLDRHVRSLLASSLSVAVLFLLFSGLSCSDDGDCHTHIACCGGIVVLRHCHPRHGSHDHPGYEPSAQVAVLATDAPDEAVRSLYVTVHEITLESGEVDPQPLFRSETGHRVDLLSLRGSEETRLYDLLAAPSLVPAATYDSIWISMADPTIVLRSGQVVRADDIELDGAVDIVFREPIPLGSEEAVYLVLDVDAKRSLSRAETAGGESRPSLSAAGSWRLRPVIFVTVVRGEVSGALLAPTDLEGTVEELEPSEGTFDVELPDGRGTVNIQAYRETAFLGPALEGQRFETLYLGATVRVRGYWRADGGFDAESVVRGSMFRVTGTVEAIEGNGIVVVPLREDGAGETIRVEATRDSLLSFDRVERAEFHQIEHGTEVTMTAYRSGSPGDGPTAALVDLRRAPADLDLSVRPGRERWPPVGGSVQQIDLERRVVVLQSVDGERRVDVPRGAEVLFLEREDGVLLQTPINLAQIRVGMNVEIERLPGEPGESGPPALFLFSLKGDES